MRTHGEDVASLNASMAVRSLFRGTRLPAKHEPCAPRDRPRRSAPPINWMTVGADVLLQSAAGWTRWPSSISFWMVGLRDAAFDAHLCPA